MTQMTVTLKRAERFDDDASDGEAEVRVTQNISSDNRTLISDNRTLI